MISRPSIIWHVAQTQSQREQRAAAELDKQGFEVFLPRYLKQVRHARRKVSVAASLFPGYLFVGFGPQARWRSINGTVGVIRLVMAAGQPAPLESGVVDGLMARCDEKGFIPLPSRDVIQPGDVVCIRDGSFAQSLGLFEEVKDSDRVAILLDLLGRKVRVVLDAAQVEKAA